MECSSIIHLQNVLQESENYNISDAHGGILFIETTEPNQTSVLTDAVLLHTRDSFCGCSAGLLPQIHGSF